MTIARPWLTFYGDDFTGSSAVMEVLAFAGVPTAMFLDAPDDALLARFPDLKAIGIAGISRSQSPEWMDEHLPRYYSALARFGAPLVHYKTCSTFDSSPVLGSIGRAAEIGLRVTGSAWAPLVVGSPAIGRYQMFGNLFAAFDGAVHRLDRHPVMSRHPATPMHEADLCRHLAAQTSLATASIDFPTILGGGGEAAIAAARAKGARIVALDFFDDATGRDVGKIVWQAASEARPLLAVGSQGLEYALVAHWRQCGLLPATHATPSLDAVDRLLVVSGSCSPTTARQIADAERAGFAMLALDAVAALDARGWAREIARVIAEAQGLLAAGRNVLVCTARGPDDPAIGRLNEALAAHAGAAADVHARIGGGLGAVVREIRLLTGLERAIIAGGDTSGHALLALGVSALLPKCPLAPGAPLLAAVSQDAGIDGLELSLKGGQMGGADFFVRALSG